jgi:hypothetical protein
MYIYINNYETIITMSRVKSKNLFDLIKSMNKNEKRYFKLNMAPSEHEDRKVLLLFDLINKQEHFDEDAILKKEPSLNPAQLSNLKAYLYEKVLQSIRQFNAPKIEDIKIREQIDFAQVLFERRLYQLGKNCLSKAKKMAKAHTNLELQLEIIKLEKSILMQTIDEDGTKVDNIISEVRSINSAINNINIFSNLSIKLNSFYTRIGYIRDKNDYLQAKEFFYSKLPEYKESELSISEKIYLFKLYVGYYFFIQDFDLGYAYSKKLENLFESSPSMIRTNTESYISALNSLLIAQYKLFKYHEFLNTNKKLQSVKQMSALNINENIRIRLLKYYYMHEINHFFMTGDFIKGVDLIQNQGTQAEHFISLLDKHSAMILNYKIACLYFGAGNFSQAIRWMNKIINIANADIREDLHCFARIINLICHYELGNFDVINYYIISTYRFLFKKDDLHLFQKFILKFLKNLNSETNNKELLEGFKQLKVQLMPLVNMVYEKRAFIYFDIISWLESKIEKKSVQEIIKEKFTLKKSSEN